MSLCLAFLLMIAVQGLVSSSALATPASAAVANQGGGGNNDDTTYDHGLCQSFTHGETPQEWKNKGLCDADSSQKFVHPSGGGACQQNWLKEMTQTGQQVCVLTVVSLRSSCPEGFALDGGRCDAEPQGRLGWQVGLCEAFQTGEVPPEWIRSHVCDINPVPNPEQKFIEQPEPGDESCRPNWIKTMVRTSQQECVLTVPAFKSQCPVGFALDGGRCDYQPQNSGSWQVGFCKSLSSQEVPPEWISSHVCDISPIPNPEQAFVQPSNNGPCSPSWVNTMTLTGQPECVLTVPPLRGNTCPIGFVVSDGRCQYVPQNSGSWRVGLCKSFTTDEIPPEWIASHVCDTNPIPNPEQTFITAGPCQPGWIATTAESPQVKCLLTLPTVRGLCPVGFALDGGHCDYVPQGKTSWQAGFCQSFGTDEIPAVWVSNHVCDTNPIPDPEQTFIRSVPCLPSWLETTSGTGQVECVLTIPSVRGLCPVGFALDGAKCDYVPQSKTTWVVGFCKSFSSDEVPAEWMSNHVCDTNPVPDPEQTFIKAGPCLHNWIRTAAEGGLAPKCALTVPAIRGLCPIGFALDEASCQYVPQNVTGWRFPCSDLANGTANEAAIATDWLSGDSPRTASLTSDLTNGEGGTGGRFVHTFAADTYGLTSVQEVFRSMLGLAFVLVTPVMILIGYHLLLAASSFRHAGVLEGISRVFLGVVAVGISFELVTMLISCANVVSGAIVGLHGMLGYPATQVDGRTAYTLAGVNEPLSSYRGLVMPMSRWGCAVNDFIGILGNKFFSAQVTAWLPVIGNLAPLATTVTNGAELANRVGEFARLILSVALWLQVVIRIGILNCYIVTCPLAFACWALPGGLGQQVVHQWTKGFLAVLFIQVVQLFLITMLPLVLPSFPALAGDNGIMAVLLTQLPPLLVLWLTVRVPGLLGMGVTRAVGMAGVMAGGVVGAVGAAASLLG